MLHVRICAGGRPQGRSLPRPPRSIRLSALPASVWSPAERQTVMTLEAAHCAATMAGMPPTVPALDLVNQAVVRQAGESDEQGDATLLERAEQVQDGDPSDTSLTPSV